MIMLIVAAASAILVVSKVGRLYLAVWGGAFAFASGGVGFGKAAYTGYLLLLALASLPSTRGLEGRSRTAVKRVLASVTAVSLLCVLGMSVGLFKNGTALYVFRDAATYVILAASMVVAYSWRGVLTTKQAAWLVVVFGTFSAFVFMVNLLDARATGALGFGRFAAGSMLVVLVCTAVLFAGVATGVLRLGFSVFPAVWLALILASGTRTGFAVLSVPAAIFFLTIARPIAYPRAGRVITSALIATVALPTVGWLLITSVAPPDFLRARIDATSGILRGGLANDPSAIARLEDHRRAMAYFDDSMWVGQGFGQVKSIEQATDVSGGFYLDTPALYLAKFGLVGTALLLLGIWTWFRGMVASTDHHGSNEAARLAIYSVAIGLLTTSPFGALSEDKGLGVALILLSVGAHAMSADKAREET
jgi:O-antigen ligase